MAPRPLTTTLLILLAALLALPAMPAGAGAAASPVAGALPHWGFRGDLDYYGAGSEPTKPAFGPAVVCGDIERQVVLLNPELVAGEPLHFRLLLRATEPQRNPIFNARLAFGTDIRVLLIAPEGRTSYEFLGLRLGSNVPGASVEFSTFSTLRLDFRMAMDRDTLSGAVFDEPGTYALRVLHTCRQQGGPPEELHLGDFGVTVREPSGDDQLALDILSDHRVFELFQLRSTYHPTGRLVATEQHMAMLRQLVEEAPAAALRPHAMMILADHADREGRPDEAFHLYEQLITGYPGSVVAGEATIGRLNLALSQSMTEEAREAFAEIWSSPSLTQVILPGSPQWDTFVAAYIPPTRRGQWMIFERPGPEPRMAEGDGGRVVFSEDVQAEWGLPPELEGTQFELPFMP